MSAVDLVIAAGVALLAGGVNSIAGGGSLILFPTLVALGLGTVAANVTNSLAQWPGYLDEVCYDFPELVLVTRHGGEPWQALLVKLMLKWPGLHYSTSAFAPKHFPREIIDYANTRGADKIIYAGYFPMGLSLDRIFNDMPKVAFKDEVWPKFLHDNAARVLKVG